ncbi:MAG: hypothetical protein HY549_07685 [Elusimicrobia bacterium]|nr:hypothetical protein [Elusimicrobiota bacterium]
MEKTRLSRIFALAAMLALTGNGAMATPVHDPEAEVKKTIGEIKTAYQSEERAVNRLFSELIGRNQPLNLNSIQAINPRLHTALEARMPTSHSLAFMGLSLPEKAAMLGAFKEEPERDRLRVRIERALDLDRSKNKLDLSLKFAKEGSEQYKSHLDEAVRLAKSSDFVIPASINAALAEISGRGLQKAADRKQRMEAAGRSAEEGRTGLSGDKTDISPAVAGQNYLACSDDPALEAECRRAKGKEQRLPVPAGKSDPWLRPALPGQIAPLAHDDPAQDAAIKRKALEGLKP